MSYNDSDINEADLVMFHMQRVKGPKDLPPQKTRNPKQIWTFLTDESPFHMFLSYNGALKDFNNVFNWSMTYRYYNSKKLEFEIKTKTKTFVISNIISCRIKTNLFYEFSMNSDIPVAYGRATAFHSPQALEIDDFTNWKNNKDQNVLVAIMGSNCGGRNHRWDYVRELKKYIKVDVYGNCGTLKLV